MDPLILYIYLYLYISKYKSYENDYLLYDNTVTKIILQLSQTSDNHAIVYHTVAHLEFLEFLYVQGVCHFPNMSCQNGNICKKKKF